MGQLVLTREAVGWDMHLRLLGPFEMVVGSGPVHLAGRGERALVTLLGLSPGRVVADTTLIEQLWSDGDQPVDPVNALQTRVSKARRALAGAGRGEVLTRQGAGYRLDVDPAGVDVHRFTASIDRARCAGPRTRRSAGMTRRWRSGGQSRSRNSLANRGPWWRPRGWSSCGSRPSPSAPNGC